MGKIDIDKLTPDQLEGLYWQLMATRDVCLEAGNDSRVRAYQKTIETVRLKLVARVGETTKNIIENDIDFNMSPK